VLSPEELKKIYLFCSRHKKFTQLSPEEQEHFILKAIESGKQVARTVKQDYNDMPLDKLLVRLGIALEYDNRENQIGNMVVRAKYAGNPPTITIYRKTIQQLDENKKYSLNAQQLEEIALAHELYHHINYIEIQNSKFKIQKNEQRKKIPRLFDELAAQSFTQYYLGLTFFPLSIDFKQF
jgi:precorrin-6B methylase 2